MNDEKVIEYPQQVREQQNVHCQTSTPQHVIQQTVVAQRSLAAEFLNKPRLLVFPHDWDNLTVLLP
jgi:hypothetical protein